MSLSSYIHVNTRYTRSIHIERDSETGSQPYILTSRAMQVLARVADTLDSEPKPRSFALIGPYGSGKSAFGLFLAQLLGNGETEGSQHARNLLAVAMPTLAKNFTDSLAKTKGYCVVTMTGSPEPLARSLLRAINTAAGRFFTNKKKRPAELLQRMEAAAANGDCKIGRLIELIADLQEAILDYQGAGLLIVIDELGKFLEYEARHREASDIYLLQAIAEHGLRGQEAPLHLVVLLHQSFEQYAQTLGEQLRNEWKKVQGRFETIPFLETTEQTIRIVRAALSSEFDGTTKKRIASESCRMTAVLKEQHALPPAMTQEDAADLFAGCYPLHPLTLLLLPTLCQRAAQNERTLFSYLGSREPHGFLETLERLQWKGENLPWITPAEIYDYFILNQPGLITDHLTHRRWAEIVTALERLGDAPDASVRLLKTIGLMNIVGAQGGLKPSFDLLALCADTGGIAIDLAALTEKSLITYRKYNGEYRVWQGTDFDLEAALTEQLAQISGLDIAELLNETKPIMPIVARRHAIKTGTLRFFLPEFVSAASKTRLKPTDQPTLFICLTSNLEENAAFGKILHKITKDHTVGVVAGNPQDLCEAVLTVEALTRIQRGNAQLSNDPVAQRELKDRLAFAKRTETIILSSILDEPKLSEWFIQGKQSLALDTKRQLQERLSKLLDDVYKYAPVLKNELINRDKPSSSAMAGRNKLITAMFNHSNEEELGITKYPSEKSMYRSLLKATSLHKRGVDGWGFNSPDSKTEFKMERVWQFIESSLNETETKPLEVSLLFSGLYQPPFGLKAGVVPIIFLAYLLANNDELVLFEEGQFAPFLSLEVYDRLIRNPQAFSLQRFRLDNIREALFRKYVEVIDGDTPNEANLLTAVKPLARMMVNLPDYTKQTARLSKEAVAVRDLFFQAKSPANLMLVDLPKACGFEAFTGGNVDAVALEAFTQKFQLVIREIKSAYHLLLSDFQMLFKKSFGIDEKIHLNDLRDMLRGRCMNLDKYTIDIHGLRAFLGRITDKYGDESIWLVSIASFLGRKPPEKWRDEDFQAAEYRLAEFAKRIHDIEQLRLSHEHRVAGFDKDVEVMMIKTIRPLLGEQEYFVTINAEKKKAFKKNVDLALEFLSKIDDDLKLAAFATILEHFTNLQKPSISDESISLDGTSA